MARILIVDDAAFMRMMLKDILTKGGFEIAGEAADGNEAVSKYNELKPDLVTNLNPRFFISLLIASDSGK